jgi:hypothetical protein
MNDEAFAVSMLDLIFRARAKILPCSGNSFPARCLEFPFWESPENPNYSKSLHGVGRPQAEKFPAIREIDPG